MEISGPNITAMYLTSDVVQVYADGTELVQITREQGTGPWLLPYVENDVTQLAFREECNAVDHIAWDAQTLSQAKFQEKYPAFVPVITRTLDGTCTAIERGGQLLVFAYLDATTGRWRLQTRDRRQYRMAGGGWNHLAAAVEYVIAHVEDFLPIPLVLADKAS